MWRTRLSLRIGSGDGSGVSLELRGWINSGLMTIFFFVVGLEARREFDMGELRERRRVALPLMAGISGMILPVAIFLALNAGRGTEHGWGAAMSTDTAFALGMLALLGNRLPTSLRTFILSVAVVDDFVALAVIAVAYSEHVAMLPCWSPSPSSPWSWCSGPPVYGAESSTCCSPRRPGSRYWSRASTRSSSAS